MNSSLRRAVRLAVILPPLVFASGYGYLRFIRSPAFLSLIERVLALSLEADVSIGSHELESRSRIVLRDLNAEFRAGGAPSGIHFGAKQAVAEAAWLLGVGPFERITLADVQMRLDAPASTVAKLDVLSRPGGTTSVNRIVLEGMRVEFVIGGQVCHVGGMVCVFDLMGELAELSASLPVLKIEGMDTPGLDAEAPSISLAVEIRGPEVSVRRLKVAGRSGWQVAGDVKLDISTDDPAIEGAFDLWDLPVSRIYQAAEGVELPPLAKVMRRIVLNGTVGDLHVQAGTSLRGLSYHDTRLGLKAEDVTLDLQTACRVDLRAVVRGLLSDDGRRE